MPLYERKLKKKGPSPKNKASAQSGTKEAITFKMKRADFEVLDNNFILQTRANSEWIRFGYSNIMAACFRLATVAYRKGALPTQYKNEIGFTIGFLGALQKVKSRDVEEAAIETARREIEG